MILRYSIADWPAGLEPPPAALISFSALLGFLQGTSQSNASLETAASHLFHGQQIKTLLERCKSRELNHLGQVIDWPVTV